MNKIDDFSKKDADLLAGSKKVATFASAFEKYRFLQRLKVYNKGAENRTEQEISKDAKVLEKRFAGLKKMTYLCSPFALQNARLFPKGSLNY
ncbi:hypothetical protein [Alistipes sp.]|uniref:hypothetical protein n=1 Tax=Alistipes sp. TaxID=1872444 RepID=UPI003AB488F4